MRHLFDGFIVTVSIGPVAESYESPPGMTVDQAMAVALEQAMELGLRSRIAAEPELLLDGSLKVRARSLERHLALRLPPGQRIRRFPMLPDPARA